MASLGRVRNSLVMRTNEKINALASLNFDFSLANVQAPRKYNSLGKALSRSRKNDAEDGPTHKIARNVTRGMELSAVSCRILAKDS